MINKNHNKGFTLAELLVVVAIIAVLVAISIPIFTKQTEKSKEAVDIANMRNAYSLMSLSIINDDTIDGKSVSQYTSNNPLYYDGSKLTSQKPSSIGKGTSHDGGMTYHRCNDYTYDSTSNYTKSVIVCYFQDNQVHIHWDNASSSETSNKGEFNNGTSTITIANKTYTASIIPDKDTLSNDSIGTLKTGHIYNYKGHTYIVNIDNILSKWTCPDSSGSDYIYTKYTGRVVTSTDTSINIGDIYNDGSNLYIRKYANASQGQWTSPTSYDNNWQVITTN